MLEALALIRSTTKTGCGMHACNPSIWRVEQKGVKDHLQLHRVEASLSYTQRVELPLVWLLWFSPFFFPNLSLSVGVFCLSVCLFMGDWFPGRQRRMLDPGELELQML